MPLSNEKEILPNIVFNLKCIINIVKTEAYVPSCVI